MQTSRMLARAQSFQKAKAIVKIVSNVTCVACARGRKHDVYACGHDKGIPDFESYTMLRKKFTSYEEAWEFALSHASSMGPFKTNKKGIAIAKGKTPYGMTVKLLTTKAS